MLTALRDSRLPVPPPLTPFSAFLLVFNFRKETLAPGPRRTALSLIVAGPFLAVCNVRSRCHAEKYQLRDPHSGGQNSRVRAKVLQFERYLTVEVAIDPAAQTVIEPKSPERAFELQIADHVARHFYKFAR